VEAKNVNYAKKLNFAGIGRKCRHFAKIGEFENCVEIGGICNMHRWLRGMDASDFTSRPTRKTWKHLDARFFCRNSPLKIKRLPYANLQTVITFTKLNNRWLDVTQNNFAITVACTLTITITAIIATTFCSDLGIFESVEIWVEVEVDSVCRVG